MGWGVLTTKKMILGKINAARAKKSRPDGYRRKIIRDGFRNVCNVRNIYPIDARSNAHLRTPPVPTY